MRKSLAISLICLTVTGSALARQSPTGFRSIFEIDGCVEWSGLYFCKESPYDKTLAMQLARACMNDNGAQGYQIEFQYTPSPYGQVNKHYDIYYKYCTLDENGENPAGDFNRWVTNALSALFDDRLVVSERLTDLAGHTRIYVMDPVGGGLFETTWSEDGGLVDFHEIDPDTDDDFGYQLEEGLSFYLLILSSDE